MTWKRMALVLAAAVLLGGPGASAQDNMDKLESTTPEERATLLQNVLLPPQYQQWLAQREEMRQKIEQKSMEKRAGGGN